MSWHECWKNYFKVHYVLQSHKNVDLEAGMNVHLMHVGMPQGGVATRKKHYGFKLSKFFDNKQCIIRMKNKDKHCSCSYDSYFLCEYFTKSAFFLNWFWMVQRSCLWDWKPPKSSSTFHWTFCQCPWKPCSKNLVSMNWRKATFHISLIKRTTLRRPATNGWRLWSW